MVVNISLNYDDRKSPSFVAVFDIYEVEILFYHYCGIFVRSVKWVPLFLDVRPSHNIHSVNVVLCVYGVLFLGAVT